MNDQKPRRGRPPKIDPTHILQVAREVFLARGIRATTLEVAERAGVSEGSIFYRFKTKEGLFREAMELTEESLPDRLIEAIEVLNTTTDLEVSLNQLAQSLIDIARVALPLMMMSWSNPSCQGGPDQKNALRFREFVVRLGGYFQVHMDAGRMRRVDGEVLARTFIGAIHHYCMSRMFSEEHGIPVLAEGTFIRNHVDLLLRGVLPIPEAAAPKTAYSRRLD